MRAPIYAALVFSILALATAVSHVFLLPEVHVDPRGECVRVMEGGRAQACTRIPERHIRVVVAGRAS